ncbi:metallophosphoesterase [Halodesulfovibrio aestuarii]|uniref:metallophosphoesterase n=1 Tax=Halodesulfovibrio aestuarii TaxID=126333 RepID=UPI003D32AA56
MPHSDKSIFAIGDIHGDNDALTRLLRRLPVRPDTDQLVFMGDYINRGEDTRAVLETLIEVKKQYAHTVFLMGNHEHLLLEYASHPDIEILRTLRKMGIETTLASYDATVRELQGLSFMPESHRNFLHSLALSYSCDPYLFVHADTEEADIAASMTASEISNPHRAVLVDKALSNRRLIREYVKDESRQNITSKTEQENGEPASAGASNSGSCTICAFNASDAGGVTVTTPYKQERLVVFAHVSFEMPLVMPDRICVDTGSVYGNMLTALELPAMRFHHA